MCIVYSAGNCAVATVAASLRHTCVCSAMIDSHPLPTAAAFAVVASMQELQIIIFPPRIYDVEVYLRRASLVRNSALCNSVSSICLARECMLKVVLEPREQIKRTRSSALSLVNVRVWCRQMVARKDDLFYRQPWKKFVFLSGNM